jgi:hypothetical protein
MSREAGPFPRFPAPADWVLAFLLVALSLGSWAWWGRRPPGSQVVVECTRQLQRQPLDLDQVLLCQGPLGQSRVEIAGGRARIAASPCPEQRCVLQGWIHRQGETAACLPNRLVLRVEEGAGAMDALSR